MHHQHLVIIATCILLGLCGRGGTCQDESPDSKDVSFPNVTFSGYLPVKDEAALFYTFYESERHHHHSSDPIILWLQGGPGCASSFGNFYELGPQLVTPHLKLRPNPGAWNRRAALLFIDQPIGTGFSVAGSHGIPEDEMEMAADLYVGLQRFFKLNPHLSHRPLVIAGESYAGKYVPSIGHFILQQQKHLGAAAPSHGGTLGTGQPLRHVRPLPEELLLGREEELGCAPRFKLAGLVIGNGLTDPAAQVGTHADVAHSLGLLDDQQRDQARIMQQHVQQLIAGGQWAKAHEQRGELLEYIAKSAGAATLLDVTRYEDYDADKLVDAFLNQKHVKEALRVPPELTYTSCSAKVGEALGRDVMKTVRYLIPDLLDEYPLLLFQGVHDIQDGPSSTEAWLRLLEWSGRELFLGAKRQIVHLSDILCATGWPQQQQQEQDSATVSGDCSCSSSSSESEMGVPSSSVGVQVGAHAETQAQAGEALQLLGWQGGDKQRGDKQLDLARRLLGAQPQEAAGAGGAAQQAAAAGGGAGSSASVSNQEGRRCQAVAAYWKSRDRLSHVVIRDAGHMPPHDVPHTAQYMIERWLGEVVAGREAGDASG